MTLEFVSVDPDDPIVNGRALARNIVAAMPTRLPFTIDAPTLALFVLLDECCALSVVEVVKALGAPLASVHAWIARAERLGVVRRTREVTRTDRTNRRRPDGLDGRATIVSLTAKGRAWIGRCRG